MKKIAYFLSIVILFTTVSPAAMADVISEDKGKPELSDDDQARLEQIQLRVGEIKAMDLAALSKDELKEVRVELKELRREAKQAGGGIYLSVGAIIVILLVLILLT